jgi:multimeric flavodoxin WrbA
MGMNHRILIINGAVREGGNMDALVKAFTKGARAAGIRVRRAVLRDLSFSDCRGCYQCRDEGSCSIDDDMTRLRGDITKADVIVFASPLYFCGVTGLMKTFLDRLYFFYHEKNKDQIARKKVVLLIPLGEEKAGYETSIVEEFFARYLRALDLELLDMVFFPDLMHKEATTEHPEVVDRAYYAGRSLQIQLRKLDIKSEMEMLKLQFGVPKKKARMKG